MSKTNLVFAIAKLMNREGEEPSDDKILQIQKQMKYLKIEWAVLKWNDWWMLIKVINERLKLQNACKSECLLKWYAYWLADAERLGH